MLVTKIEDSLKLYLSNEDVFSILIDGKWGCGKTHLIREFLKNNKHNYIYLSLFGVNSINDIVIRLSEKIDSSYIVNINSNYFVPNTCEEKKYNKGLIIFDDIERKNAALSFEEICGIIWTLKTQGFKIISIIDSEEIVDRNYGKYLEKTFDRILYVEADAGVMNDVLKSNITLEASFLKTAGGNYRLVRKAFTLLNEIEDHMKKQKNYNCLLKEFDDKSRLMRCIIIALRCYYWCDSSDDNSLECSNKIDVYVKNNLKSYIERVNRGIKYFFGEGKKGEEKYKENISLKPDVVLLLQAIKNSDFDCLVSVKEDKFDIMDQEPFCEEIYYCDDEGKENYKKSFLNQIQKFDFSKKNQFDLLLNVMKYSNSPFSKEELSQVAEQIIQTYDFNKMDVMFRLIDDYKYMEEDKKTRECIESIKKILEEKYKSKENNNLYNEINEAMVNSDYSILCDYLYKYRDDKKAELIASIFEQADYFLPDLSGKLTNSMWRYCHEIARFIASNGDHVKKFMDLLVEQCKHSKSKSLIDRCDALVKYNFDQNFNDYLASNKN